ncbi:MAG: hypothetical protein GTO55_00405 [Armatimonadetes bacterium]|nr:hypothetical protein [Armatimonadota bacterium]NIM23897.1 hypothetical protein [Armatimonadota bacterium]NIM66616.1 hypothetical protein [Armatimonadota bacterium]NIM76284.1 hypothetical protein [Armatimonadota bacterium]NIN05978.1 hypothetical protein [Armatimonadota bacterium]
MRVMTILLFSLMCALLLSAAAFAGSSFRGYSGLVNIPTADSLDMGEYNLAVFTVERDKGESHTVLAANIGLLPGLEVGAARERPEGGDADILLNGKLGLQSESFTRPKIAVGINDVADERNRTSYLVISKSLVPLSEVFHREVFNLTLHAGVGDGRLDGLFWGVSAGVGNTATLMVEHDGEEFNAGIRFAVGSTVQFHTAALDDFDDFGLGISINRRL